MSVVTLATSDQVEPNADQPDNLDFFGMSAGDVPQGMDPDALVDISGSEAPEPISQDPSQEEPAEDDSLAVWGIQSDSPEPQDETEVTSPVDVQEEEPEISEEEDVLYVDEQGNPVDREGNRIEVQTPLYYVGEGMDYGDDLDKFKESHRKKEEYIGVLSSQVEAAEQSRQQANDRMAEMEAEFKAMQASYFGGLSEDEHLSRIAFTQLPDELRNVSDELPVESSFMPDRDEFIERYISEALGHKSESDFADENMYSMKRKEARSKAVNAYDSEVENAKESYRDALTKHIQNKTNKEAELARITERLRSERNNALDEMKRQRADEEALAKAALEEVERFGKAQPLNFSDKELNAKAVSILREIGFIDERGLPTDKFIVLQAQYGSQVRDMLFTGIKQQVLQSKPLVGKKKVVVVKPRTKSARPPVQLTSSDDDPTDYEEEFKSVGWL